jgi:dehydrogenase/reductase SDR family member 4
LLQSFGHIDILVSNAAANPSVDSILEMKESVLDKLWDINVKASILLIQVSKFFHLLNILYQQSCHHSLPLPNVFQDAAPHLRKGSSVIIISSIAGYNPEQGLTMYGVTKTALFGLTKVYVYVFWSFFTLFAVTDQCQIILLLFTCIDKF